MQLHIIIATAQISSSSAHQSAYDSSIITLSAWPACFLQHLAILIRVVPIKESHTLDIQWDIPPTEHHYRQAPTNYLSHLLGHEGSGSAFALLKSQGLVTSLSAGEGGGLSSRGFFGVRVELTEEGNQKVGDVAEVVFKYLDLLRQPEAVNEQV